MDLNFRVVKMHVKINKTVKYYLQYLPSMCHYCI